MNITQHFSPKNFKRTVFVLFAVVTFFGMFWYVNKYLYKFFAAGTNVTVNFSPATVTTTNGSEFDVSILMGGQKISATEFYIEYDANLLEYAKEYAPNGTGFSQTTDYFEDPIIEEVTANGTKKTLKLALVTLEQNQTSDVKQIALKFKSKANGTATIRLLNATKIAGIDSAGSPMYFDKITTTGTVTVTIGTGGDGVTPTTEPTPAGPIINVDMTSSVLSRKEVGDEFNIGVKFSGQTDVSGVELYVAYPDEQVQYATEFTPSISGFTQQGDYFEDPIIEQVTAAGNLKLALVTLSDTPMPDGYTINLKFKGTSVGVAQIRLSGNTKVSGVYNNNAVFFDVLSANAVTSVPIGVDGPTVTPGDGSPTVTPGDGSPTVTPGGGSPDPTGGSPEPGTSVSINVILRYQGILEQPDESRQKIVTAFTLVSKDGTVRKTSTATVNAQPDTTWTGTVAFTGIPTNKKYSLFIKGEKHLQKEICDADPSETIPGSYHCATGNITLNSGQNSLDLSSVYLLAGDIPEQNGIVDAVDFSFIRQNFGSQSEDIILRGDLNYDGIVDTQDYSLVLAALAFKYDEE